MNNFHAITLSYKLCPIAYREVFSFNDEQIATLLKSIKSVVPVEDIFIISTCNRTEIYYHAEHVYNDFIIKLIGIQVGLFSTNFSYYFQFLNGKDAINHLYHVALGLDSMILGDMQIINQVKRAYQLAADLNTVGPFGHRLMHSIFHTNKRVNLETKFREGNSSVASAAVGRAKEFATQFRSPSILIIGLGEIGETVAENLKKFEGSVTVINRTIEKAKSIATKYNYHFLPIEQLDQEINKADIIISAVRSEQPIINCDTFDHIKIRHKLMVDLSVPRSISADVATLKGVYTVNVDELVKQTEQTKLLRESKIMEVSQIVETSIEELNDWNDTHQFSPIIKQFKAALEDIRQKEVKRHLENVDESSAQVIELATKNIIQKIIKLPVLQLKNNCKREDSEQLAAVLQSLFNLEIPASQHKYI